MSSPQPLTCCELLGLWVPGAWSLFAWSPYPDTGILMVLRMFKCLVNVQIGKAGMCTCKRRCWHSPERGVCDSLELLVGSEPPDVSAGN